MEKNQQNPSDTTPSTQKATKGGERPGQQLPTGNENTQHESGENSTDLEQHSESSLPERDEETLGTP
ncbi:MAG TPA: hypothetical protein VGE06_00180 [Flavisolibacter sp.]